MNLFDKICAVPAFVLGVVFLLLGGIGVFTGCKANFVLPPVLGVIPAFVGWGILRAVWIAWKRPPRQYEPPSREPWPSRPPEQTAQPLD